jgi:hypothetical protein
VGIPGPHNHPRFAAESCYAFRNMRAQILIAVCLGGVLPGFTQNASSPQPGLPKDPRAVFAAAAPFYNFSDPALKPWHLKATYQLYDEKGKPAEEGTFEYWSGISFFGTGFMKLYRS